MLIAPRYVTRINLWNKFQIYNRNIISQNSMIKRNLQDKVNVGYQYNNLIQFLKKYKDDKKLLFLVNNDGMKIPQK